MLRAGTIWSKLFLNIAVRLLLCLFRIHDMEFFWCMRRTFMIVLCIFAPDRRSAMFFGLRRFIGHCGPPPIFNLMRGWVFRQKWSLKKSASKALIKKLNSEFELCPPWLRSLVSWKAGGKSRVEMLWGVLRGVAGRERICGLALVDCWRPMRASIRVRAPVVICPPGRLGAAGIICSRVDPAHRKGSVCLTLDK